MARISRKELKTDEFAAEVSKTVEFVQTNRQRLIAAGVVVAVLVIVGGGGYTWYTKRAEGASEALGNAMRTYHAPVRPVSLSDAPGELVFGTDNQRATQALTEFQAVADKYSWMRVGKTAQYYAGLCQTTLGNLPEAEKQLNAVASSSDSFVAPLAKMALANLYARENKTAQAQQLYQDLIDHPSDSLPKATAQLALAEFLQPTKPAEADKIFKDVAASNPGPDVAELIAKARQGK